jgi:hypothetical protein
MEALYPPPGVRGRDAWNFASPPQAQDELGRGLSRHVHGHATDRSLETLDLWCSVANRCVTATITPRAGLHDTGRVAGLSCFRVHRSLLAGAAACLTQSDVTACLVTRGDQPEGDGNSVSAVASSSTTCVVWDNSVQGGLEVRRPLQGSRARTHRHRLLPGRRRARPGEHAVGAPAGVRARRVRRELGHGENPDGYDDLPLVCGGAIVDRQLCFDAINRYAEHWPFDDAFRTRPTSSSVRSTRRSSIWICRSTST